MREAAVDGVFPNFNGLLYLCRYASVKLPRLAELRRHFDSVVQYDVWTGTPAEYSEGDEDFLRQMVRHLPSSLK